MKVAITYEFSFDEREAIAGRHGRLATHAECKALLFALIRGDLEQIVADYEQDARSSGRAIDLMEALKESLASKREQNIDA